MIKSSLMDKFPIKDLGPVKKCLGINVSVNQNEGTIKLDQSKYTMPMLKNFGMHDRKGATTPMNPGASLTAMEGGMDTSIPYRNAVDALLYLF